MIDMKVDTEAFAYQFTTQGQLQCAVANGADRASFSNNFSNRAYALLDSFGRRSGTGLACNCLGSAVA